MEKKLINCKEGKIGDPLRPMGSANDMLWKWIASGKLRCLGSSLISDHGDSQLEAFSTSGDSPGKESNDGR